MTTDKGIEIVEGEAQGRVAVLRVRGRLDAETAPVLLERCAMVQANGEDLVLNMADVTFLGSSGVGAMLVLVEQFQEQAGSVHFVALSEAARMVVELLDLGHYLTIDPTEERALESLVPR